MNDAVVTRMDRPDPSLCPARVRASIDAYCELGMPPGDFVRSVLANDLYDAVTRADDINLPALPHIVAYVVQRVPVAICGSHADVNRHVAAKKEARKEFGRLDSDGARIPQYVVDAVTQQGTLTDLRVAAEPYGPSETQMRARIASLMPDDEAER